MKSALVALSTAAVLLVGLSAQIDLAKLGPQVGDRAITFTLSDQKGASQTLETVAGPKGTMLVFFRSANW